MKNASEAFVLRPRPWRVLRFYFWIGFSVTVGPLLLGLWSGIVAFVLTRHSLGEIVAICIDLVGWAPLFGTVAVLLSVPAGWVLLADCRRQRWEIGPEGLMLHPALSGSPGPRIIRWEEIATVRVGLNGPLVLMKDRCQEGAQLWFVPREDSLRLYRRWLALKTDVA